MSLGVYESAAARIPRVTIAVSIRTSTDVVFAADSRLTTYGRAGYDTKGEPIIVPQTYENATKIVRDTSGTAMVVAWHQFAPEAATR
jgi:hypothetical protein